MDHLFLIANWANYVAQAIFVAAVTVTAWRSSDPGVRFACRVNLVFWPVTTVFSLLPVPEAPAMWVVCALDLGAAGGFLYAAARYNSLWISAAVLAQGVQTAVDVIYIGQGSSFDRLHHFMFGAMDNLFTYVIQAAILGAALAARRRLALRGAVRV